MATKAPRWVEVDDVKQALGLTPYDDVDDVWLSNVCDAVNVFVADERKDLTVPDGVQFDPAVFASTQFQSVIGGGAVFPDYSTNARVRLGAVMYAVRLYQRRNGNETASFGELGYPLPAADKDIELLLEIGRAFRPVVA